MVITMQFCYFVVMSSTILTLFGDEPAPEQLNAVGKSRAKKPELVPEKEVKKEEKKEEKKAEKKVEVQEKPKEEKKAAPVKKKAVKAPKAEKKKKDTKEKKEILVGWQPEKQYYSIGEVATLFEVATSHIRFWTNEFELKVRTTRKGDRLYTPEQIKELRVIYHLVKENGYTIAGAKARLKDAKKTPAAAIDLKHSLLQLRNKLLQIRNEI
jgi:DNA-binding transcriptional MerR regulator